MSKRGNGEGTIYFSEKLNKWVGQFTAGRKENGKIDRKSVYGNTRKEVKEKITKALADVQSKTFVNKSDITIAQLGKSLIENKFNANRISEATYGRALGTFNIIKNSDIADIPIQKIEVFQLQDFINRQKDYANSYIDKIYEMLGSIFKEAINRDIIVKNPLNNVLKPKSNTLFSLKTVIYFICIALCAGIMQFSTNYVFERMDVGYALALFQLSLVLSVIFGFVFFKEKNIIKKLAGSFIMICGSVLIILY